VIQVDNEPVARAIPMRLPGGKPASGTYLALRPDPPAEAVAVVASSGDHLASETGSEADKPVGSGLSSRWRPISVLGGRWSAGLRTCVVAVRIGHTLELSERGQSNLA